MGLVVLLWAMLEASGVGFVLFLFVQILFALLTTRTSLLIPFVPCFQLFPCFRSKSFWCGLWIGMPAVSYVMGAATERTFVLVVALAFIAGLILMLALF